MKLIQYVLLVLTGLVYFFVHSSRKHLKRAISRFGFLISFVGFSGVIFFPKILQSLANFFGVGRGTDLLVYLMAMGFFVGVLLILLKIKEMEEKIARIVREVALKNLDK